jgi:methylenetetrahydrofolate reductase (NADPH)
MGFIDKMRQGGFAVTIELNPPRGVGMKRFWREAEMLRPLGDAFNVTDCQRSSMKTGPVGVCHLLERAGMESVVQVTLRDRNRLAYQSELLSAYLLGIRNFLIVSGDHPLCGNHPDAEGVFDIDSTQGIHVATMLKQGTDMVGNKLNKAPKDINLGGALNPFSHLAELEIIKARKKVHQGAIFFQTQPIYDVDRFADFIAGLKDMDCFVIAGILPLTSHKTATIMKTRVAGIHLPDSVFKRITESPDPTKEGIALARETIEKLRGISHGIHMMSIDSIEHVPDILEGTVDR